MGKSCICGDRSHMAILCFSQRKQPETGATNENKEILWRVNFEEFVRRLRHKVFIYLFFLHTQKNIFSLS